MIFIRTLAQMEADFIARTPLDDRLGTPSGDPIRFQALLDEKPGVIAFGLTDVPTVVSWLVETDELAQALLQRGGTSSARIWLRSDVVAAIGAFAEDWNIAELACGLMGKLGPIPTKLLRNHLLSQIRRLFRGDA